MKTQYTCLKNNEAGSALIGVMVAGLLSSFLIIATYDLASSNRDSHAYLVLREAANSVQASLVGLVSTSYEQLQILKDNSQPGGVLNGSCLTASPFSCTNGTVLGPLVIKNFYSAGPQALIDNAPGSGLTYDGQRCTAYGLAGKGSDTCPLQATVSLVITCPTGACSPYNYQFNFQFTITGENPDFSMAFDSKNLDSGAVLNYTNPATLSCFTYIYDTTTPANTSVSSGAPFTTSYMLTNNTYPYNAPNAQGLWGAFCPAGWWALACDNVTVLGGIPVIGSFITGNGCYSDTTVTASDDDFIELTCCQGSTPGP